MRAIGSLRWILIVSLAGGCGSESGDGGPAAQLSVRDSMGIRIVENGSLSADLWQVSPEPAFTAGWDESGPQFTWAQSGQILPDGGAVVGDSQAGIVYRFDSSGAVVETWGRSGEGPGEYQRFDALIRKGDSILVSDGRLRRVTVRAASGAVRTAPLPTSLVLPVVSGTLSDGRLLIVNGEGFAGVAETRPEWVFETQPIIVADLERETADTVAELPHLRRWYGTRGASPGAIHVKGRAGALPDGFAWSRADQREVRWFDSSGELLQIARWQEESAKLTAEGRDEMRSIWEGVFSARGPEFAATQLARMDEDLDRYEGLLPYWDNLVVDINGNVWLSEHVLPLRPLAEWRVFARDGSAVGWVALPGVRAILDITDDRILAVLTDDLDVPAVVMLRLIKP
jgi:hypothetical protein